MEPQNKKINHAKYTVSVRIRPKINQTQQTVFTTSQGKNVKQLRPKSIVTYCFDNVFEESHDNQYIFERSIRERVDIFLNKKVNTTILAYGQTGSGKTHTLFGHKNSNQLGLTHYIIDQIMTFCKQKGLKAKSTFLQMYKQKVTDLLNNQQVALRDNSKGDLVLQNNKVVEVNSKQELLQLFTQANKNKIFGNSYVHSESSRSHVLFQVQIEGTKLNIVDLCGSQLLTYKFDQNQRKQTNAINLSLFTLNAVISDLCEKNQAKFIPFRNSVLTRLLKNSLIDDKKTQIYLFCNISPQKQHQQFSRSTLRFGQLAIQIDEKNNIPEQVVNLSQQKRQSKKVSNIIQVNAKMNKKFYDLPQKWQIFPLKIFNKNVKCYKLQKQNSKINILLLHAYGEGCDGTDFNNFAAILLKYFNCNLYSVDFPGFGKSQGERFTSRAQKFHQKQQSLDFIKELLKQMKFSKANPVYLFGYDLGGAIALRCSIQGKLNQIIAGTIAFHPTWTQKIQKLALIQLPVLLLWFPIQNFHLISAGQKMAKVMKESILYKFNVGASTQQKSAGYYDYYSEQICLKIIEWLQQKKKQTSSQKDLNTIGNNNRGKAIQQNVVLNINLEEEKINKTAEAIKILYESFKEKNQKIIFESIIKGGQNKPKFIKLTSELPVLNIQNMKWDFLLKWKIFDQGPIQTFNFDDNPFLTPNRQIHIRESINMSVLHGKDKYLTYDNENGEIGITHKAFIGTQLSQQKILENQKVQILIKSYKNPEQYIPIQADLDDIINLNSATRFKKNILGHYVFQDNVTCKYDSSVMKLILLRCAFLLKQIIPKMNFKQNDDKLLDLQKQATQIIFKTMDLRHLVHQGIDNTRYTGTDAARLAYYGQGNCHHLASTLAALLLPFGKLLGWDVIFRAGSFFMTGRQLNQNGQPLKNWKGKPNVNVEDHTWLEIVYKPSNKIFLFDPSFSLCNYDLDQVYSLNGKMHISGKPLNFAASPNLPKKIC